MQSLPCAVTENTLDEWWSFPHHESHHLSMLSVCISDSSSNMNISDNCLSCKLSHSTSRFLLNGLILRRGKGRKAKYNRPVYYHLLGCTKIWSPVIDSCDVFQSWAAVSEQRSLALSSHLCVQSSLDPFSVFCNA